MRTLDDFALLSMEEDGAYASLEDCGAGGIYAVATGRVLGPDGELMAPPPAAPPRRRDAGRGQGPKSGRAHVTSKAAGVDAARGVLGGASALAPAGWQV